MQVVGSPNPFVVCLDAMDLDLRGKIQKFFAWLDLAQIQPEFYRSKSMDFKYFKYGGIWEISHTRSLLFLSSLT